MGKRLPILTKALPFGYGKGMVYSRLGHNFLHPIFGETGAERGELIGTEFVSAPFRWHHDIQTPKPSASFTDIGSKVKR